MSSFRLQDDARKWAILSSPIIGRKLRHKDLAQRHPGKKQRSWDVNWGRGCTVEGENWLFRPATTIPKPLPQCRLLAYSSGSSERREIRNSPFTHLLVLSVMCWVWLWACRAQIFAHLPPPGCPSSLPYSWLLAHGWESRNVCFDVLCPLQFHTPPLLPALLLVICWYVEIGVWGGMLF